MPIITFLPSGKQLEVQPGTRLFDAAFTAGLPVASSCNGDGVCGKCNMTVLAGEANLSPRSELEVKLLKKEKNPPADRISCQTKVLGDCKITTRYW